MSKEKEKSLIVIERDGMERYLLDNRTYWDVGRLSKNNYPDIRLDSPTVSRKHGRFQNINGFWFYIDRMGKNGTIYNNKPIKPGLNGRVRPVMMNHGDVLIFGGGERPIIDDHTVWAMFVENDPDWIWDMVDIKDKTICLTDGNDTFCYKEPEKGTTIIKDSGIAIYMGNVIYLAGNLIMREAN